MDSLNLRMTVLLLWSIVTKTVNAQIYSIPENIKIGFFARPSVDFYKFYNGAAHKEGIYTIRNTPGYNAGILVQSKIYNVFEAYLGAGFGETTYKPNVAFGQEKLQSVGLRAFEINLGGELRFYESGKVIPAITVGLQGVAVRQKTEIAFPYLSEEHSWPTFRVMPQLGVNYHIRLNRKWELLSGAGVRVLWNKNLGWEYGFNRVFANIGLLYQLKEW